MSFYTQERHVLGVRLRAHDVVSTEALHEAARRVRRLLGGCATIAANLEQAGAELHVIGRDQQVTDLPMYRHMRGVPFDGTQTMDERGRGYGGLFACTAEESLLGLPSARHRDLRDVCTHELAHTVQDYGLDPALRERIVARYEAVRDAGTWRGTYAITNPAEFWAELSMWYVGSRGDYGALARPGEGRQWLQAHDPGSFALLDTIYSGQVEPSRFAWIDLQPTDARRSRVGPATSIVFVNGTPRPLGLSWVDYDGRARSYGVVPAEGVSAQSTYVTHLWRLSDGERVLGTWAAGERPGRVRVATSSRWT